MKIINSENRKQEWKTLRDLHGLKKLQHITFYYKIHISVFLGMIFLMVILLSAYRDNLTPPRLYISLFTDSSVDYSQWAKNRINLMPEGSGDIEWMQSTYFTPSSFNAGIDKNYLSTRIGVSEIDLVISTSALYEYMRELDCILPLNHIFEEKQLKKYHDRLITAESPKEDTAYAVWLDSSQFPESEREPYYLYICSSTQHLTDAAAMFQIITRR